ncbi:MAG TPA: polyprenyl synthetase family protein [Acidimicrobiales bacterium]|nr:polyprenyl synthetase family protein [Acidimicrobiales bacterium]
MGSNPLLEFPGVDDHLARVDERLLAAVTTDDPHLTEMTSHLIKAGGKRLRPLMGVLSAATGAENGGTGVTLDVIDGGVAVELVQVGSLYHDDVIDEAETRRGVPSVNVRWNNLTAILAGDFLLAKASEIAARLGTEVAGLLARTIGRLCEGEITELRYAYSTDRPEAAYFAAIEGKTASLYATACRIGGIVGGLPRPQVDALTEYGQAFGVAFQLVDDVLDLTASEEVLGKPTAHDLTEGIYNLPVLRALQTDAGDEIRSLLGTPVEGDERERVRQLVIASGGIEATVEEAQRFVDQACAALDAVDDTPATKALAGGAEHLLTTIS